MSDVIAANKYEGVKMEEYKGAYSLLAMKGSDGTYYPMWAKYRKGKDAYQDKDWPVKVSLGDKESAIAILKTLLIELGADDVPF